MQISALLGQASVVVWRFSSLTRRWLSAPLSQQCQNCTVSPSTAVHTSTESKRKLGIMFHYLVFKTLHRPKPWEVVEGRQEKPNWDCWDIHFFTPLTLRYIWHEPFLWQPQLYKIWPGQGNTQLWHLLAHNSLSQKTATSFWHESKYCSELQQHPLWTGVR